MPTIAHSRVILVSAECAFSPNKGIQMDIINSNSQQRGRVALTKTTLTAGRLYAISNNSSPERVVLGIHPRTTRNDEAFVGVEVLSGMCWVLDANPVYTIRELPNAVIDIRDTELT